MGGGGGGKKRSLNIRTRCEGENEHKHNWFAAMGERVCACVCRSRLDVKRG